MPIRPSRPEDMDTIVELIHGLAEYEHEPESVTLQPDELRQYLFGERPYAEVLMAETDSGESAGFALFFHNFSTWKGKPGIYLEDLFVRPEYRGHGFGRQLLVELAGIAIDRGCGRFEWSVLDWNEPAMGFYRALGAVAMEEWTVHRVTGEALAGLAAQRGRK